MTTEGSPTGAALARHNGSSPLAALRRLAEAPAAAEPLTRCDLCSAPVAPHPHHEHLLEPAVHGIACACTPCALLFPPEAEKRYRRVPRRLWRLRDFALSDEQWEALAIPVNIAYLHTRAMDGAVHGYYPSPAGATESLLTLDGWAAVVAANPVLRTLQPDVEALLINRVGEQRENYIAPIDRCYELVGLIRLSWRGLSGGTEVWARIAAFFEGLREYSVERGAGGA